MKIHLSLEEKASLEKQHRTERDGGIRDRIKAVLLTHEGWSMEQIGQALRIHLETVRTHLQEYTQSQKLKPENGGSSSKLSTEQASELIAHLECTSYMNVRDICGHVSRTYGVSYTIQGMTSWLHAHHFSYKKPAATPAKADPAKQAYATLLKVTPEDEPILFGG